MNLSRFPLLLRPYIVRELPGWGRLINLLGIRGVDNVNPKWRDAGIVFVRGKLHGYIMELDLKDDLERGTYFMGRYYDLETQLILDALLKSGDTFMDIGANIGMITLHGASRVGKCGRVIAFEPQSLCCGKIRRNVELNKIHHVQIHNVGLADKDAELTLMVLGGATVHSYLCQEGYGLNAREKIVVPVKRGDDIVGDQIIGDLVIKIDVEGYELHALRGLIETIKTHRPPVISEACAHYFNRAGTDEYQYFDFFHALDYHAYEISSEYTGLVGRRKQNFRLRPINCLSDHYRGDSVADILWLYKTYRCLELRIDR